jgi:hypothetical protein
MRDPDPVIALWCAGQLAAQPGWQAAGAGPRLLGSVRAAVRAFAVEHLADDLLPREVLRGMLADRSGMVRSIARWRWTQAGQDPVPVYRELLASPLPRQVAAALDGLDDLGDGSLPAAAVPFLAHPSRLAPGVLEELDAAGTPRSRLSPWDRVGAGLAAIGDPDPALTSEQRREVAFVAGIRPEPSV